MYVVKKYIRAISALDAVRKEKDTSVDEVSLDASWKDLYLSEAMGLQSMREDDDEV